MEDINTENNNNINNNEIELSEVFMTKNNDKRIEGYSLIPSNYGKITNTDIENELNSKKIILNNNKNESIYIFMHIFSLLLSKIIKIIKNLYIQLSFNWCYDIIKKGKISKLTMESFKNIPPYYSAKELFNNIYPHWQSYYKKNNYKDNNKKNFHLLFKLLLKIHLKKIFLACFFLFFSTLLDFGGILVFNELLKRFNNEAKEEKDTIFNLSKISLLKLIIFMITYAPITFILHFQASHIFDVISFSSQSQLKCLIFDKVLKIPTYIKTNFTQGKIINLIQSDSSKFGELITTILEVFSLPIKILYSTILLFTFYGYTVVPCFIILFLLFFLFFYFGKKQNEYENDLMEISDKRMNVLSQTFNIIKIIKLYVSEKLFIKKIEKVKEEENIIMRKKANMTLIVNSSYWNTDTLLILIIVIFYFLKYQKLDNSKIFTTMFIFYTIIDQLYCFPIIITNLNDTFISLKRIQLFLEMKEHNKNHLQYIEEESNYSIEIDGANFGVLKSQNYKEEKGQKNNKNENENENDEENDLKLLEEENIGIAWMLELLQEIF